MLLFKMSSGEGRGVRRSGSAARDTICQWRTLSLRLLLLVFVFGGLVQDAQGYHTTAMCVQFGQANAAGRIKDYTDPRRHGPWTVGTRNFDIKYSYLDLSGYHVDPFEKNTPQSSPCPYNTTDPKVEINPCVPDNEVELQTYAVKQDGKVLNGWLHVEIELKDPKDNILAIYVQVRDEHYDAVGEFVSDPREQCEQTKKNPILSQPTQYQIYPCSAVGYRNAKVATAMFMAEKHVYKNLSLIENYLPATSISRGIHFTWRLNEYWCNRHLRFRPEATILTEKMVKRGSIYGKPLVYRKAPTYWLRPQWYGAADIKKPQTTLSCKDPVIDYSNGKVNVEHAPWLYPEGIRSIYSNDYIARTQFVNDKGTEAFQCCQWDIRDFRNRALEDKNNFLPDIAPTFAGRCVSFFKKAQHDSLHGCNLNTSAPEFEGFQDNFTVYSSYVNTLTINRTHLCGVSCRVPTPADIESIQNFTDMSGEANFTQTSKYFSQSRNESRTEKLLVGRKYHATLCVIWTMFLTPLGIFCARYFKETCMNVTCSGAHFWFWVHVTTAVAASAMFVSSLSGIWYNLETWGRNEDSAGNSHRAVGYFSASLFLLMMILGAFRPLQKSMRIVMMTVHSFLGFLIYFCNVLAMVLSFFIPASPTLGDCDEKGYPTKMSDAIYPIAIWVGIDILLHIAMTVFQLMKDKSVGLRRPWYCPIIPILPHDSADDFVGSSLRKITLMVYGGAAFIMTSVTIGLLHGSNVPPMQCQDLTGRSSCHETWGCSASAVAYSMKVERMKISQTGNY